MASQHGWETDPVSTLLGQVHEAITRSLYSSIADRPLLSTTAQLINYLKFAMCHADVEQVRVIYLNGANRLIRDEILVTGTVNRAPIYPREIVKRALECGATALIVAHNHPSGDPTPSSIDIVATQRLVRACQEMEIVVHDHLIITQSSWTSLKQEGLL